MFTRRFLLAAAASAPALAHAQTGAAPAAPPSVDELLAEPELLDAALSPNGKQFAVLRQTKQNGKRQAYVVLAPTDDPDAQPRGVTLGDRRVDQVEWGNDERLLIWITYDADEHGRPYGVVEGNLFVPVPCKRVVSVSLQGSDPVELFSGNRRVLRNDFDVSRVVDFMPDDPRLIMMQVWDEGHEAWALHHVDIYTGQASPVEYGSHDTDYWLTQRGVPIVRVDTNWRGTVASIYGRSPGESDWKLVRKARLDEFKKLPDFDVVGVAADSGVLLVSTRAGGGDVKTIRTFDLRTLQFGDEVGSAPGRDMLSVAVDTGQAVIASSYLDDRLNYRFVEAAFDRHFKGVNTYFANEANVAIYEVDRSHTKYVLSVTGPRDPGSFYIYHRDRAHLEPLGPTLPKLTQERLAPMEALKVRTRDGAEITAYLTRPIGPLKGPLPLVVVPHGGPEVRDHMDWDLFAQTFAARGWLVLQPNFRGSGGYGRAFADLGRRHWGDRMQEDVEDAVALVVDKGLADPKRLAICGASYGGYSAMMGAVRRPELYKAVVSIAGDCELLETLAFSRSEDGADSPTYAYWLASIGDPKSDEAMLVAASPARHAATIAAPVLLIHGTEDKIVDPKQSKIMARALKAAGKPYSYMELKGEGHGGWSKDTWKKVLTSSADFIGQHI